MMDEIIDKVKQWGFDRNFHISSNFQKQKIKLFEECKEIIDSHPTIADAIGDSFVVLVQMYDANKIKRICKESHIILHANKEDPLELAHGLNPQSEILLRYIINVLRSIAIQHELTLKECVEIAYDEIKDRKGEWNAGLYVKSE